MRTWILLALAAVSFGAIGCTSDVHAAIRDGEEDKPTADTGAIASSTTGGDAAGTLNLDAKAPKNPEPRPRGPRGGG